MYKGDNMKNLIKRREFLQKSYQYHCDRSAYHNYMSDVATLEIARITEELKNKIMPVEE